MSGLRKVLVLVLLLTALLPTTAPVASQGGRGAIIEANPRGVEGLGSLNPLRCNRAACRRVTDFLFPWLLGVDPETKTFDGSGLTRSWETGADGVITFALREDLAWSDGTPITAYDVFYSYLSLASREIRSPYSGRVAAAITGAAPLDEHTIAFIYVDGVGCAALDYTQFPIIPAHVFEPEFAATAAAVFDGGDARADYTSWQEQQADRSFAWMRTHSFDQYPTVTAGVFQIDGIQPPDYVRLLTPDGDLGFAYVDLPENRTAVELFLQGETNLLADPPFARREDIRAADDVQVFEAPGRTWLAISLNLADPWLPQGAVDDDGNPLDQGMHPVFGDVRVRRALQLAMDVERQIEVVTQGNGTALATYNLPAFWGYDDDLLPVPFDPRAAEQLLESAGWKDTNRDGIRECRGCLYAQEGARLSFDLAVPDSTIYNVELLATQIAQQAEDVGFMVTINSVDRGVATNVVRRQVYDAYMIEFTDGYPVNPDATLSALFSPAEDVLGYGLNFGSYNSPALDDVLAQARDLPGCDFAARAALYRQAQTILQDDQPYIWLFAPNEMLVAQGAVTGFDPYPHAPFWNVAEWVVVR
ncbi:MAG: hypothetical protein GYB65_11820 [Chloroflexi bacterium]|nr:hypothetical protein [Chloroflexota bacterium]